jgi:hypothetical protein
MSRIVIGIYYETLLLDGDEWSDSSSDLSISGELPVAIVWEPERIPGPILAS